MRLRSAILVAVVAGAAAGALAGLLVAAVQDGGSSIRLGNLGEWAAALGTSGALIFAYWALRDERAARRQEADRVARVDAKKVLLKVNARDFGLQGEPGRRALSTLEAAPVVVNGTLQEVDDVELELVVGEQVLMTYEIGSMYAGDARAVAKFTQTWQGPPPEGQFDGRLSFTLEGRRWEVTGRGGLRPIPFPEAAKKGPRRAPSLADDDKTTGRQ